MTELIGLRAGAYPVRRRDSLKSSEELGSCQKQMARACLARRKLTQLGFSPRGIGVRGVHAPSGSQCASSLPYQKGEIQSSECVVFTPLGGPMCITPIDSSQGHSYQGQPEAFPTIRCRLGGISFRGPHTAEVLLCDEMSTQEPCTHY